MKKIITLIVSILMSTMISPLSFAADSLQIIPEAKKPTEV
jgi:hypothetical protein